jgi:hypothetical protein
MTTPITIAGPLSFESFDLEILEAIAPEMTDELEIAEARYSEESKN